METGTIKPIKARRLAILLILSVKDANGKQNQPILGLTRIQKLLFLVSDRTERVLKDSPYVHFDFSYEPEKFGPADLDLYQDLDFLRDMRFITLAGADTVEPTEEPSLSSLVLSPNSKALALLPEEKEEQELSFEYLIGSEPVELLATKTETRTELQYSITDNGLKLIEAVHAKSVGVQKEHLDVLERACAEVRQQFGDWALRRLLKYIYDNYASLITKSTIIERVKGNW